MVMPTLEIPLTQKLENDSFGRPVYVGKAMPGTPSSSAGWQIQKITYDGSGFVTDIQWADSSAKFEKIWDNRTSYVYK